ncbi:hypothetical protein [Chryseobacterium sp.]|uniref:hypothetical protein n=1 Tax=Chryseobacterium sp. TaxID=1871047 RepID=UPI0024E1E8E6|nr:hypothetical protein [Chryseobacterium sp.]
MIAPQELRIGNYLQDREDNLCQVVELGKDSVYAPVIGKAGTKLPNKPIDLTEEWLIKFGLKNSEAGYKVIVKQTKFSAIKAKGFFSVWLAGPFGLYLVKLKYVHQLQNLYQSVFLEEITIKE